MSPQRGMPIRPLFRTLLILCCFASGRVLADELKIIFMQYTPPYVLADGTGILVDIVRTALESSGHKVQPVLVPIGRGFKMFAKGQVDGTSLLQESSGLKAEYSQDFMQYHNRAFALKKRNLSIRTIADLKDKSVLAFQNAEKYLGEDFRRAVAGNPQYKEIAQQEAQARMLFLYRTDVAVMDESVFRYYRQKLINEGKADRGEEYVGFDVFPPTRYKAAFSSRKVRDDFDKGIAAMRKDGRYDAIYRKYAERYFPIEK
jgi:polar amino acid transport system substrate-binding protein